MVARVCAFRVFVWLFVYLLLGWFGCVFIVWLALNLVGLCLIVASGLWFAWWMGYELTDLLLCCVCFIVNDCCFGLVSVVWCLCLSFLVIVLWLEWRVWLVGIWFVSLEVCVGMVYMVGLLWLWCFIVFSWLLWGGFVGVLVFVLPLG